MNILNVCKNFWIDFFVAYHNRLIKNSKQETPLTNLFTLSFVQTVNFDTMVVVVLTIFFPLVKLNFILLFLPFVIFNIINSYLFYFKLKQEGRRKILSRIPKFKTIFYDIYFLCSHILFMFSLYLASKV